MKRCVIHGIYTEDRCPKCKSQSNKRYDKYKRDKELDSFYKSKAWRRLRNRFIKANPICTSCGYPAQIVDHIVEIKDGGEKLSWNNLQSLCTSCHNSKTQRAKANRGGAKKSLGDSSRVTVAPPKFSQNLRDGGTP